LISKVYPNIAVARSETQRLRGQLAQFLAEEGLALVSAGTHPGAMWMDQLTTPHPRYLALEEEFQDVARSVLIYGVHVYVAVENNELAIKLINQVRTWVPQPIAFSSYSPLWGLPLTVLPSYRSVGG